MYFVYVLRSQKRKYLYVGLTGDLKQRLKHHHSGYEQTTKAYRPFDLIHVEQYQTRLEARQREKYLKSGVGKEQLKALIKNNGDVVKLANT